MKRRFLLVLFSLVSVLPASAGQFDLFQQLHHQAPGLKTDVLKLALHAYQKLAQTGVAKNRKLTVIDYTLPSTKKRLWVFDLASAKLDYQGLVSHGKNTGLNHATHFTNQPGSKASSLGVFVTGQPYYGQHGYSLRLRGMDKGFNDNAYSRAIVVHGANYVSQNYVRRIGRLGRSWGCFVLDPRDVQGVINEIKGGGVIISYYPDKNWLSHSQYI